MKAPAGKQSFFIKKLINILNKEQIPLKVVDTKGNEYLTRQSDIKHTLIIRNPKFYKALVSPDALSLGESYINGHFDVKGDMKDLYESCMASLLYTDRRKSLFKILSGLFLNKLKKEKGNIRYHYDVPSNFYRVFLGETMGYTCGYYDDDTATMDEAQNQKIDIICRKLRLKAGEDVLDIGCGWGNFAVFAAKNYKVNVTGITLSREQREYALKWIDKEKLRDRINIKLLNYRELGNRVFDKITCIGMSEHVGLANMSGFFNKIYECLKPGGLFMQHTITTNIRKKKGYENTFLDRYMFPGGELMCEHDLVDLAAASGFELLNAENFRPHYIRTLNDWIIRMEKHKDSLIRIVSDTVFRIYHIFFIGSLVSFKTNEIALFQNLFYKNHQKEIKTDFFSSLCLQNEPLSS